MVTEGGDPVEQRVTPLELFFDLVLVFALTQVTGFLTHHLTWLGCCRPPRCSRRYGLHGRVTRG
jgi:Bacterial low temperature requirement A protein (LtrA)